MNLKGTTLISTYFIAFIISILNITQAQGQYIQKRKHAMPEFAYETLSGKKFSSEDLKKDKKIMLVYFNPICDICQRETEMILENINYFQDVHIVMISPSKKEDVLKYNKKYGLDKFHQITVLHDKGDTFYKQFGAIGYPTTYLYNKKKELIVYFDTEVEFEDIKDAYGTTVAKNQ